MPSVIASSAHCRLGREASAGWAASGTPEVGDAVGGAGEVEQVRAFGVVELQRAGEASSTDAEAPAIAPRSSLE